MLDFTHNGRIYCGWTMEEAVASGIPQATMDAIVAAQARAAMTCTPRQARLALTGAGLLGAVEAWVASVGGATAIDWEYATEIRRDFPALAGAATALGLTDAQVDTLFETAATL